MENKFDVHILVAMSNGAVTVNFLKANTKEPYIGEVPNYLSEKISEILATFEFELVDSKFCLAFSRAVQTFCIEHEIPNYHDTILEVKTR